MSDLWRVTVRTDHMALEGMVEGFDRLTAFADAMQPFGKVLASRVELEPEERA